MTEETVISVRNLGKKFLIGERRQSYGNLRDSIASVASRITGRTPKKRKPSEFWALRDISFDVKRGEVIGLIGHNGAGKSTLLKILSRITEPTSGYADIRGRVGALLEVGTGFHNELTGRENVYLSGAILGMKKAEIDERFDEIVSFAGVEQFVDTPIKRFSTGMVLRLGFAVAAHMEPDILLVDEVLAVGDIEFQRKCLNKMESTALAGRTVLFVSHNIGSIKELCEKAIVLKEGRIDFQGDVVEGIRHYSQNLMKMSESTESEPNRSGIVSISIDGGGDDSNQVQNTLPFSIRCELQVPKAIKGTGIHCFLEDSEGVQVVHNRFHGFGELDRGRFEIKAEVPPLFLKPGVYTLYLKIVADEVGSEQFRLVRYFSERLVVDVSDGTGIFSGKVRATILPPVEWSISGADSGTAVFSRQSDGVNLHERNSE